MSVPKTSYAKHVIVIASVLFMAFEVLIMSGVLTIENTPLLPANLQTQKEWWNNPTLWIIGITIAVNFYGYFENVVIKKQEYNYAMFVETFAKYTPMLLIFSQALPNEQAGVLAFALDYMHRTFKKKPETETTAAAVPK